MKYVIGVMMASLLLLAPQVQAQPPLLSQVNQALRTASLPVTPALQQRFAAQVVRGEITTFTELVAAMREHRADIPADRPLIQRVNEGLRTVGLPVTGDLQRRFADRVFRGEINTFTELLAAMREFRQEGRADRPLLHRVNEALRVASLPVTPALQQRFAAQVVRGEITTFNELVAVMRGDAQPQTVRVQAAFLNPNRLAAGQDACTTVFPIDRINTGTPGVARAALLQLLAGPTTVERNAGYRTAIPAGVRLQGLSISGGTARADFNQALQQGVAGSCRVQQIRSQITRTLTQFPTVDRVIISINGRTEGILQP